MRKFLAILVFGLIVTLTVVTCKKDDATSAVDNAACDVVILAAEVTGGCNIQLATPTKCEVIDLSGGKSYEFAWTTGGSNCETPYFLFIAGNPATDQNTKSWSFSENVSAGITKTGGGIVRVSAVDLTGLSTDNGTYHWVIKGFFGSHPNSRTFRVKM